MASELVGVNKNTDAQFYDRIRQVISLNLESPFMHVKWRLTKAISTVQEKANVVVEQVGKLL